MARLSVGLEAIGRDVAVLSVELNQLDPEGKGQWYQWKDGSEESLARVAQLLVSDAVPWLNRHTGLEELIRALQSRVAIVPPTHRRKWWQLGVAPAAKPRVNSNNLRYLSYCYEALGRYADALEWWERYVSTLTLMAPGSDQAKDTEKRGQYLAARASDVSG